MTETEDYKSAAAAELAAHEVKPEIHQLYDQAAIWPAGVWRSVQENCIPFTSAAMVANYLKATPILIQKDRTLTAIGMWVTVAAAGLARMGIYDNHTDIKPNSLLVDAGAVNCSTIGWKELPIAITLTRGIYWLTLLMNCTASTYRMNKAGTPSLVGVPYRDTGPSSHGESIYTYGALPNPFPIITNWSTGHPPAPLIK